MVRARRDAARDLDVERRVAVQKIGVREQSPSDVVQPRRRGDVGARNPQLVQPTLQARYVPIGLEQRPTDRAPYFLYPVADHDAPVVDRNGRGRAGQEMAVEIGKHVTE